MFGSDKIFRLVAYPGNHIGWFANEEKARKHALRKGLHSFAIYRYGKIVYEQGLGGF